MELQNINEVWAICEKAPLYEVSTFGNIRKLNDDKNSSYYFTNGYPCACLLLSGRSFLKIKIHRLVAIAFIPNPENKATVNHKDCDRANNHISNLEWATQKENVRHAWANNRCKSGVARPCFNVETGIFYDTLMEAAKAHNINLVKFRWRLRKKSKKNTTFIYV